MNESRRSESLMSGSSASCAAKTSSLINATVILVHGAWADGSCWTNVILPLQGHGMRVMAVQLPLTSLTGDAEALRRVIERTEGPLVLVGHAYGGAVIAAVEAENVIALVYVAGLAPEHGETVADVFYRAKPHRSAPQLAPDAHGVIWMPDAGFRDAVAPKASQEQLAVMTVVQQPIAVRCIQERAPVPAWKRTPSWYLVAGEDRMIVPETQRFMAERMGATIRAHPVDHSPMYEAPERVVEVIVEAARAAGAMA